MAYKLNDMSQDYIKNILKKYGLSPNFTYGQNFLTDDLVLTDIVDAAKLVSGDAILEIGPGLGTLTQKLLEASKFVLAIEKDKKFFPVLRVLKKEYENFRFEVDDALEFNFQDYFKNEGFKNYKVVANIPYFITGKILRMLMTAPFKPSSITVLAQKEVVQNVIAGPGNLSILAISVQLYGTPKLVSVVPAKSFYPAPKVDSAILHIELFEKPKYTISNEKKFFKILKACFSGKRKQLHNTLVSNLHLEKEFVTKLLTELNIPAMARPQELNIEQWVALVNKLEI